MKKFVNDPKQFVPEMLEGIALANPDTIKYVPQYNLIMRTDAPRDDKVSIVQGSGSEHEPAHVMIVGKGMLDAACPGGVFAAPPMDHVLETTKLLNSDKGSCTSSTTTRATAWRSTWARRWPRPRASGSRRCWSTTTSRSGLDVHRRPPGRRRELLRDQGGGRGLRARCRPRHARGPRQPGQLGSTWRASVTLVKLDDDLRDLFDAPVETPIRVY